MSLKYKAITEKQYHHLLPMFIRHNSVCVELPNGSMHYSFEKSGTYYRLSSFNDGEYELTIKVR